MALSGRHHAAVSQELAADGLDQPAAVAIASPCLYIAVKLRVAVITTQRPAEIVHDDRISVERGKVIAVGLLPDTKAQSFGFYVHVRRRSAQQEAFAQRIARIDEELMAPGEKRTAANLGYNRLVRAEGPRLGPSAVEGLADIALDLDDLVHADLPAGVV